MNGCRVGEGRKRQTERDQSGGRVSSVLPPLLGPDRGTKRGSLQDSPIGNEQEIHINLMKGGEGRNL